MKWPFDIILTSTLAGFAFMQTGCSLLQRSPESGYANTRGDRDSEVLADQQAEKMNHQRDDSALEMGLGMSHSLTSSEREALEERVRLKEAEHAIHSRRDREQYYKFKPSMKNDRERIEFLQIGTYEGRERWLQRSGIGNGNDHFSEKDRELIEDSDVAVGMTRQAVRQSWGEPQMVEVAGNPLYANERWKYSQFVSSPDGYQPETKVVYFEAGRVVGWEKF